MTSPAHVSRVRALYKRILMLHRFMPIDLRALGDQYVKEEFRRHKSASAEQVQPFMKEWEGIRSLSWERWGERREYVQDGTPDCLVESKKFLRHVVEFYDPPTLPAPNTKKQHENDYRNTLQTQVLEAAGSEKMPFGAELSERQLRDFQDEQIGQLYELMLESTKPNQQFHLQEDGSPK